MQRQSKCSMKDWTQSSMYRGRESVHCCVAAALASTQGTWQTYWWWHFERATHIMIEIIGVFSLIIGGPLILCMWEYTHAIRVQNLGSLHSSESTRGGWKGKNNDELPPPGDKYVSLSGMSLHNCTPYLISHAACVSSEMKPVSVHQ